MKRDVRNSTPLPHDFPALASRLSSTPCFAGMGVKGKAGEKGLKPEAEVWREGRQLPGAEGMEASGLGRSRACTGGRGLSMRPGFKGMSDSCCRVGEGGMGLIAAPGGSGCLGKSC